MIFLINRLQQAQIIGAQRITQAFGIREGFSKAQLQSVVSVFERGGVQHSRGRGKIVDKLQMCRHQIG